MRFLFLLFFLFATESFAKDLCDLLELSNCGSITRLSRRSSLQSLPGTSTAASINPATVSFDKGLGIETMYVSGNPLQFSLAGGTGKVGAAVISTSVENGFFGNRTVELDGVYGNRLNKKKIYKSEKITLATALKLYRKKNFALDLGVIVKRHSEIKKFNPGAGLSATLGPLTFGASIYQDDFQLKQNDVFQYPTGTVYDTVVTDETYTEKFTVTTLSGGLRLWACSVDGGLIKTKYRYYEEASTTQILAGSCIYKKLRVMLATRTDKSNALKYIDDQLATAETDAQTFWGIQGAFGKHLILGVSYNYFMLDEYSLNASVFF